MIWRYHDFRNLHIYPYLPSAHSPIFDPFRSILAAETTPWIRDDATSVVPPCRRWRAKGVLHAGHAGGNTAQAAVEAAISLAAQTTIKDIKAISVVDSWFCWDLPNYLGVYWRFLEYSSASIEEIEIAEGELSGGNPSLVATNAMLKNSGRSLLIDQFIIILWLFHNRWNDMLSSMTLSTCQHEHLKLLLGQKCRFKVHWMF